MQRRGCRDRQRVVSLRGRIAKRLVLLRWLRARDYKKFEWLLETLNIVYKPRPFEHEEIQRRVHQVWSLTQFYAVDSSKSRIGGKKCVFSKRTIKPQGLRQLLLPTSWDLCI